MEVFTGIMICGSYGSRMFGKKSERSQIRLVWYAKGAEDWNAMIAVEKVSAALYRSKMELCMLIQ